MTTTPWTFGDESRAVGAGAVTLVDGATFAICDRAGDVNGQGVEGIFVADTRLCSTLVVLVDGRPCEALAVDVEAPSRARFVNRSADRAIVVRRSLRLVTGAVLQVELWGRGTTDERTVDVAVAVTSDLADVFAVKEGRASGPTVAANAGPAGAELTIGDAGGARAASIRASPAPDELDADTGGFRWRAVIPAGGRWTCSLHIVARRDGVEVPLTEHPSFRPVPVGRHAHVETDVPGLEVAARRAMEDLGALRLVDPARPADRVVAAGAPWFMTLFGRDSILTAWMSLLVDPDLGLATARTLARLQGTREVPETEEEPGRIVHELRYGPGASLALDDATRYYGTVDATPLFVLLVHELWRWGASWADIASLLPAVDAALGWMAGPGDPDGDGFVEYERKTDRGLANQGWKDSWDAISFADGRLASTPISLAEVQGYAYAAWRAGSALAAADGDHRRAAARNDRAASLAVAFEDAFWLPDRGWYALALDGDKRPVDALASNLGHLLWSGIVPARRVGAVADALLSPELASGWGLRTLATSMARYDPLGYHTGSVWPHDTAIAIAGLRRAGCTDHALRLAGSLLAAAHASDGRLPELFAGLGPDDIGVPVPYPASCSPQAWASAAPLLVLRALLGLEPDVPGGTIVLEPVLPAGATHLRVEGVPLAGTRVTMEVDGDAVAVRGLPPGVAVLLPG